MFPVTFEVEAEQRSGWTSDDWSLRPRKKKSKKRRNQRSVPEPLLMGLCSEASEGVGGHLCRLMSSVISSVVMSPHVMS